MLKSAQNGTKNTSAIGSGVQLLTFRLDEQEYALNIADVVQVVRMVSVTRAPKTDEALEGMINLRGKIIPVVDLRARCGLAPKPHDLNTQLLIAKGKERMIALTVDVVSEVLALPMTSIQGTQDIGVELDFLSGVGKVGDRLILILDPHQVLIEANGSALKHKN